MSQKVAGIGEDLEVFEDKLTITPRGVLGFMSKGLKGTKTIPFRSITSVQYRKAGAVFSGFLQFSIPGGNESKKGIFDAASDENSFMFAGAQLNDQVEQIKSYIERRIDELRIADRGGDRPVATKSLTDEIMNLQRLREQGVLTDDEFTKAKQRLIAGG